MDKLYLVMPAYNEEANIERVVGQWYPLVEEKGGQMVVVDDGSKDDTYKILCRMEKEYPHLIALTKKNEGHGATVLFGYRYALDHQADYIFQTDSDGQTRPEEFENFWEQRRFYDCVIGRRVHRGDGFSRLVVTKTLALVLRLTFGIGVKDANTPFRLMKAETLKRYIDLIPENFNLSNVLITVVLVKKKCKVAWIPITFLPRQGGKNSLNLKKIARIGLHAVRDFKKISRQL